MEKDQIKLLEELARFEAEYLLIGGQAVNAYGIPRYTKDMDVFIRSTPENAAAVHQALARFGAPLEEIAPEDFADGNTVLQIGVEPGRIDILQRISGVEFDAAWKNRVQATFEGVELMLMSIPDLIRNKQESGRPQDLADVALLKKVLADLQSEIDTDPCP